MIRRVRWPQRLKVRVINYFTSAVWRVFAHNPTTISRIQKHQNWQAGCPCHGWHLHDIQGQNGSKGRGHHRPLNGVTENEPYLPNGNAYSDLVHWLSEYVKFLPASATYVVSSKVKSQDCNATTSFWRVLPIIRPSLCEEDLLNEIELRTRYTCNCKIIFIRLC